MGTIMITACRKLGIAGVVVDGAVRDSLEIEEIGFAVFSVGTNPNGPTKNVGGRIGHPVSVGGVTVHPGDFIIGDADGVVVVERNKIASLIPLAHRKVADEAARIAAIQAGDTALRNGWTARCARPVCSSKAKHCDQAAVCWSRRRTWRPRRWPCWKALTSSMPARRRPKTTSSRCAAHHDPVAIIVRYSKVGAAAMDAAASLRVISKHGSGTDTIDKAAAAARGIEVRAAVGANAAAVAEHALALLLACAKSVPRWMRACTPVTGTRPRTRAWSWPAAPSPWWAWARSACALHAWPMRWTCASSATTRMPKTCPPGFRRWIWTRSGPKPT
jgi:hypothetical protein